MQEYIGEPTIFLRRTAATGQTQEMDERLAAACGSCIGSGKRDCRPQYCRYVLRPFCVIWCLVSLYVPAVLRRGSYVGRYASASPLRCTVRYGGSRKMRESLKMAELRVFFFYGVGMFRRQWGATTFGRVLFSFKALATPQGT